MLFRRYKLYIYIYIYIYIKCTLFKKISRKREINKGNSIC